MRIPYQWYLLIVAGVATTLRLLTITKADIWHDEGYTAMLATRSAGDIITLAAQDFHPPLYALAVHGWSLLFGTSELALRSLSLACGVGIVILIYFIMKRLQFSEATVRVATLLAAFAPFLIRYSQEARMYAMAAVLACAATLVLLIALHYKRKTDLKKRTLWWLVYGIVMAAAIYTHYYAGFIVFAHIGYAIYRYGGVRQLVRVPAWWVGNITAVALFLPWVPSAIAQFTRVQAGYWIPPISAETIPNTLMQFIAFYSNSLNSGIEFLIAVALACLVTLCIVRAKRTQRPAIWFVLAWMLSPLMIAFIISIIKQPVYYDRYFIYSAAAFSCLIAILIMNSNLNRVAKASIIGITLVVSSFGIYNVGSSATHQMATVAQFVNEDARDGDTIVSGELYTYFDFDYYNRTKITTQLYSTGPLISTGESSLLYDKQNDIAISDFSEINTQRVWLVGKTGEHDYDTTLIPESWRLQSTHQAGDSSVRLYIVNR